MVNNLSKLVIYFEIYVVRIFKVSSILKYLNKIYKEIPSYSISKQYRMSQEPHNPDLIYGELSVYSFLYLLVWISKNKNTLNKLYDLGCGNAKLVLAAALYFKEIQAIGIEIIADLITPILETGLPENLQIFENNFLDVDFSDGDIIYVNGAVLKESTWIQCCEKFELLNTNSHVISVVRKITSPSFVLIYSAIHSASWGNTWVYIYQKS